MPQFAAAETSTTTEDLTEYVSFMHKLVPGQVVTLPLEGDETSRIVSRSLNRAAKQAGMRIWRLGKASDTQVKFRVLQPEVRKRAPGAAKPGRKPGASASSKTATAKANLSAAARTARAAKASKGAAVAA